MDAAKDVISTGLSYIMGDWLAGKLTGMLTWIPGFEGVWGSVVDVAMGIADVFTGLWDVVKMTSQAIWWLLKPVRVLATFITKYLLMPFRMIGAYLGMLGKIISGVVKFFRGLFSFDTGMMADALSGIGTAILDTIKALGEILLDTFKDIPLYIWDVIKFFASALKAVFWDLPKLIWEGIKALPGMLWNGLKKLGSLWWSVVKNMPKMALNLFEKGLGLLWKVYTFMPKLLWSLFKKIPGLLWNGIKGLGKLLKLALWDIPQAIGKGIKGLAGLIWGALSALPGMIWDGFKALPGLIAKGLSSAGEAIMGLGTALWDWISSVPGSIAGAVGNIGKRFKDWLKDALPWPLSSIFGGGGDDEEVKPKVDPEKAIADANENLKYQEDYEKGMSPEAKERLKGIRDKRGDPGGLSPKEKKRRAFESRFGGAGATPPASAAAPELDATASDLAAAKSAVGDTSVPGITDNSQWNVNINTRSEKEMEQAMLKTLQKHQQKLQN